MVFSNGIKFGKSVYYCNKVSSVHSFFVIAFAVIWLFSVASECNPLFRKSITASIISLRMCKFFWHLSLLYLPWVTALVSNVITNLIHDSWYNNVFVSPLLTTFFLNKDSWSAIMFCQISVLLNAASYLDSIQFSGHWLCQLIYMNHLPQQNVHHQKFQKSQQELQFCYIFVFAHHLKPSFHI